MYRENEIIIKRLSDDDYSQWHDSVQSAYSFKSDKCLEDKLNELCTTFKNKTLNDFANTPIITTSISSISKEFDHFYEKLLENNISAHIPENHLLRSRILLTDDTSNNVYEFYISQKIFSDNDHISNGLEITIICNYIKYPIVLEYRFSDSKIVASEKLLLDKLSLSNNNNPYKLFTSILENNKIDRDTLRVLSVYIIAYLFSSIDKDFCTIESKGDYNLYKIKSIQIQDINWVKQWYVDGHDRKLPSGKVIWIEEHIRYRRNTYYADTKIN